MDEAAITVMQQVNPDSIFIRRELAGSICRRGDRYYAGRIVSGRADGFEDDFDPPACMVGDQRVGRWHSHEADGNPGPSSRDIAVANQERFLRLVFYLIVPSGEMFTYQGPDAANNIRRL